MSDSFRLSFEVESVDSRCSRSGSLATPSSCSGCASESYGCGSDRKGATGEGSGAYLHVA